MAGIGRKSGSHAGRKAGTPNRVKGKRPFIPALDKGELPLDYMLRVMRDPEAALERRDFMAAKAAPYCHRQLKAVDVTGHLTHGITKQLAEFIAGNASAARSFLNFDEEDQDQEAEAV